MSQNRSSAVMQQRIEAPDSLDFFPTPPWAVRALCEHVAPVGGHLAWDPACGDGAMERPLCDYALATAMSDVHDYGKGYAVHDFLQPFLPDGIGMAEWIVTNPPFRLAHQFIERGMQIATHGVAMLVRIAFLEGGERYRELFSKTPPALIAQFTERVPMFKGILRNPAVKYFDPEGIDPKTKKKGVWKFPSTATAYCWLVWINRAHDWEDANWLPDGATRFIWIPPCRKQLERAGDYPELAVAA